MKLALVGATGLVGKVMRMVLEEEKINISEFLPVASAKSIGKEIEFQGKLHRVISIEDAIAMEPDVALFSAGGSTSLKYAPLFAEKGCYVIDNSSAWRMDESKKLVVPEVNGQVLEKEDLIIANPNCSTIQLVMALAPLHQKFQIERLVISTYQSVSGTGAKAVKQFENELAGIENEKEMAYPHRIAGNCLPHCDVFLENGYTKEEMKLVHETRKIIGDSAIRITATAVRVPVIGAHSESVNIEFKQNFELNDIKNELILMPGVQLLDDPNNNVYPMPYKASGSNDVFVGRLRRDESCDKGLNLWIVSDNLRKGAAWNAVQILKELLQRSWIN